MKTINEFDNLKIDLSLKAKSGVDFILAATIIWFGITCIWTLPIATYDKCVLTFITGGIMLPLAGLFSKLLKTNWKVKNNPLQQLGLWFNFAQLFYFPILIFLIAKKPDYFISAYAIITGAHLFPYAWLYKEISYAVMAALMSIGVTVMSVLESVCIFYIPLYISVLLLALSLLIASSLRAKHKFVERYFESTS